MGKFTLVIFLCFLVNINLVAQDINSVFPNLPRDIIYGLTPDMKQSLLDDPNDSTKFVATAIYEKIERKALSDNFISLKTSEVGSTDIKLLPLINNSKIICLVQTVCGTICDSKISFYTDKWEPIDSAELFPKRDINWFIKPDAEKGDEKHTHAISALTMFPMQYIFSATDDTISVVFDPKSFMTNEDYNNIEPFLTKEPKVLTWDKVRFK